MSKPADADVAGQRPAADSTAGPAPLKPLDDLTRQRVELLDLGSGRRAGSLQSAQNRFKTEGIGLELREASVRRAQADGLPIYHADISTIEPGDFPSVRYVMIDNVLEHLPSLDAVATVLRSACSIASRAVHIRHPSFEHMDYLASLGLKQYWTDWPSEHTCPIQVREFAEMLTEAGRYRFMVVPVKRALDSSDPTMLPLDSPPGQRRAPGRDYGAYDAAAHGPKPEVTFDRPIYFAFDIVVLTSSELPELVYRTDPEITLRRPRFRWPESPEVGDQPGKAEPSEARSP